MQQSLTTCVEKTEGGSKPGSRTTGNIAAQSSLNFTNMPEIDFTEALRQRVSFLQSELILADQRLASRTQSQRERQDQWKKIVLQKTIRLQEFNDQLESTREELARVQQKLLQQHKYNKTLTLRCKMLEGQALSSLQKSGQTPNVLDLDVSCKSYQERCKTQPAQQISSWQGQSSVISNNLSTSKTDNKSEQNRRKLKTLLFVDMRAEKNAHGYLVKPQAMADLDRRNKEVLRLVEDMGEQYKLSKRLAISVENNLRKELARTEQQLLEARLLLSKIQQSTKHCEQNLAAKKTQNQRLKQLLVKKGDELQMAKSANEKLTEKMGTLVEQKQKLEQDIKVVRQECEGQIQKLEMMLESKEAQLLQGQEHMSQLERRQTDIEYDSETLLEQKIAIEKQNEVLAKEKEVLQQQKLELAQQLSRLREEELRGNEERADLLAELQAMEASFKETQKQKQKLESDLYLMSQKYDITSEQLNHSDTMHKNIMFQLTKLHRSYLDSIFENVYSRLPDLEEFPELEDLVENIKLGLQESKSAIRKKKPLVLKGREHSEATS